MACLLLSLYTILDRDSMPLNLCLNPLAKGAIKRCRSQILTGWRFCASIAFLDRLARGCATHCGTRPGVASAGSSREVMCGTQFQRVDRVVWAGVYSDRTGPQEADRRHRAGQTGIATQRTIAEDG